MYCSKQCSPGDTATCGGAGCYSTNSGISVCGRPTGGTSPPPSNPPPSEPPPSNPPPSNPPAAPPPSGNPTPNPDLQPPRVKIASPQEGAQVQANLNLQATVTDDVGVTKVDVFLDNKLITSKGAAPWSFPVVLPAGKHTLRVEGRDAAGKVGSAAVTVHVDGGSAPSTPPPSTSPGTPPAAPAPGKGYGEVCGAARECDSSICANDLTLGKQYCTRICDQGSPCPVGSDCFASTSGQSVCAPLTPDGVGTGPQLQPRPTEGMSCAVGRGGHPGLSPLLLLLLLWRRRR